MVKNFNQPNNLDNDNFLDDKIKNHRIIIIILSVVIVLLLAVICWLLFFNEKTVPTVEAPTNTETTVTDQPLSQNASAGIDVVWEKNITEIKSFWPDYIKSADFQKLNLNKTNLDEEALLENVKYFGRTVYKAGVINGGKYAGKDLYLFSIYAFQFQSLYFLAVLDDGQFYVLKIYEDGLHDQKVITEKILEGGGNVAYQSSVLIPAIKLDLTSFANLPDLPTSISIGDLVLERSSAQAYFMPSNSDGAKTKILKKLDDSSTLFLYDRGDNDSTLIHTGSYYVQDTAGVPYDYKFPAPKQITLADNKTVDFNYSTPHASCGEYVDNLFPFFDLAVGYKETDFVEIGKTSNNLTVYELKVDKKTKEVTQYLVTLNQLRECGVVESDETCLKKYAQPNQTEVNNFIKQTPIIYIKDPFGNFIRFVKKNFVQPAYCG